MRYDGTASELLDISASIIQGSALSSRTSVYIVNAAELTTGSGTLDNLLFKYADVVRT